MSDNMPNGNPLNLPDKIRNLLDTPAHYFAAAFCVLAFWHWQEPNPYTKIAIVAAGIILLGRIFEFGAKKVNTFRHHRVIKKRLKPLSIAEKEVLRKYVEGKTDVLVLDLAPAVFGLESKGIIARISDIGRDLSFTYCRQPRARVYLNKHRGLPFFACLALPSPHISPSPLAAARAAPLIRI